MSDPVLVTGVGGYIGRHCAAKLLREGHRVRGSVRLGPLACLALGRGPR